MSRLFLGKINLSKIKKENLFTSDSGSIYVNLTIWLNDEPDQYGNDMSLAQSTGKDEVKLYLGNAKEWKQQVSEPTKEQVDDLPF